MTLGKINDLLFSFEKTPTTKEGFKECVSWIVTINGQNFEYSEGLGHFLNSQSSLYKVIYSDLIKKTLIHSPAQRHSIYSVTPKDNDSHLGIKLGLFTSRITITGCDLNITPPKPLDVLYCLYNDSKVDLMTFEEFCSDLGYDTDSRKAFEIYNGCVDNARKFRQLQLDPQELETTFENY